MKPLYFAIAALCILYLIYDSGKKPKAVRVTIDGSQCETIKWVQRGRVHTVYLCQDTLTGTINYHSMQAISDDDYIEHVKPVQDSLMMDMYYEPIP